MCDEQRDWQVDLIAVALSAKQKSCTPATALGPSPRRQRHAIVRYAGQPGIKKQLRCMAACMDPLGILNPVRWLLIIGVINLLSRIDGRLEVVKEGSALLALAINEHIIPGQKQAPWHGALTECSSQSSPAARLPHWPEFLAIKAESCAADSSTHCRGDTSKKNGNREMWLWFEVKAEFARLTSNMDQRLTCYLLATEWQCRRESSCPDSQEEVT